jgi:hypothetical protein
MNLYAYVKNNPITDVDVDGHVDGPGQEDSRGPNGFDTETRENVNGNCKGSGDCKVADLDKKPPPAPKAQQQNINQAPQYSGQSWQLAFASVQYSQQSSITVNAKATVVPNPESLVGHALFGNGQCYSLGVAFGMPASHLNIHPGAAPDGTTPIGTMIGTFYGHNGDGTYYNNVSGQAHIASFDGFYQTTNSRGVTTTGIRAIDQWPNRPGGVGYSYYPFNSTTGNYEHHGENYRIVLGW